MNVLYNPKILLPMLILIGVALAILIWLFPKDKSSSNTYNHEENKSYLKKDHNKTNEKA